MNAVSPPVLASFDNFSYKCALGIKSRPVGVSWRLQFAIGRKNLETQLRRERKWKYPEVSGLLLNGLLL